MAKSFILLLILSRILLPVLVVIIIESISLLFGINDVPLPYYNYSHSFLRMMIIAGAIGPLTETIVFQYFMFVLFRKKMKTSYLCYILLSGLLFGIVHFQNILRVVLVLIAGIFFAFGFLIYKKKYNTITAIGLIWAIHAASNILTIVAHFVFK
ncbi:MAG: CPBP family intramembrane metalloprotease [Dysgonamonadaceae bacterium]|nr:CPBP family intramembrane metalloprotease [Dysgonamonadaceae bacterium]